MTKTTSQPAQSKTTTRGRKPKAQTTPVEDRYPNVRPEAQFVSDSGQEYLIEKTKEGFFWIKRYQGGEVNEKLKGYFTGEKAARDTLVQYLFHTDKLNRAWWPGKLNARTDLPYGAGISD